MSHQQATRAKEINYNAKEFSVTDEISPVSNAHRLDVFHTNSMLVLVRAESQREAEVTARRAINLDQHRGLCLGESI